MDERDCGYKPSLARGRHRRDPDNPGQGFYSAFYGAQTRTFAVSERHGLDRPPFDNGNAQSYLLALRDVRARGIRPDLTGTLPDALFDKRRTGLDTLIGIYWGYDGSNRLGTPPRQYNQIIRQVAMTVVNPTLGRIHNEGITLASSLRQRGDGDAGFSPGTEVLPRLPAAGRRSASTTKARTCRTHAVNVNFNAAIPGGCPRRAEHELDGHENFTPTSPPTLRHATSGRRFQSPGCFGRDRTIRAATTGPQVPRFGRIQRRQPGQQWDRAPATHAFLSRRAVADDYREPRAVSF